MLLTYASARQRLVLLPALCLFAAVALSGRGSRGARGLAAGAALILAVVLGRETDLMRDMRHVQGLGRADDAQAAASRLDRGVQLLGAGELDAAARLLEGLRREGYRSVRGEPAFFLGLAAARSARRDEAVALMREALGRAPGRPEVLAQLAVLTGEPAWAARLFRYLDELDARYELGRASLANDLPEEALAQLRQVVDALPEDRPAREELERALTRRGGGPGPRAPNPPPAP
jgi:tetratricopeptide (TPR) repeat protein